MSGMHFEKHDGDVIRCSCNDLDCVEFIKHAGCREIARQLVDIRRELKKQRAEDERLLKR